MTRISHKMIIAPNKETPETLQFAPMILLFCESQTDLWPRHIYFFQLNAHLLSLARHAQRNTLTHTKSPGAKLTHHNKTTNYNQQWRRLQRALRIIICVLSRPWRNSWKLRRTQQTDAKTHSSECKMHYSTISLADPVRDCAFFYLYIAGRCTHTHTLNYCMRPKPCWWDTH